jgi:hypothetical protein
MKTNGITQNGNIDIGGTVHNSHTANTKLFGSNFSLGDLSPTLEWAFNNTLDTDVSDQDQIANPSAPTAIQL